MSSSYRLRLITSTSALAIALSVPPGAWAGEAQEAQSGVRLEEITVTARRIEENVQKVPIAVTVISSEQLASKNISSYKDFMKVTPAFNTVTDTGAFSFMRGLQGIVTFFADAPFMLRSAGGTLDVGSVQVLKGPQGTLFGASSVSGVFVMNPRKPSETLEGFASITVGDYGRRIIEGAVSLPAVEDKLLFRIAAQSHYRKGYVTDIATSKDYYDQNYYTIRPSMIFRPTENVENYTMVQYWYQREHGGPTRIFAYAPLHPATPGAPGWDIGLNRSTGRVYASLVDPATLDRLLSGFLTDKYTYNGMAQSPGFSGRKARLIQVVNNTKWDFTDNLSLINIFMWRSFGARTANDNTGDQSSGVPSADPRAIASRVAPLNMQKTWSDELKVQGKLFDDLLNFTVGTFHSGNPAKGEVSFGNARNVLTASKTDGDVRNPAHTRAIFGQTDIDLGRAAEWADGLTFTAGGRYSWDRQIRSQTNYSVGAGTANLAYNALPITRYLYGTRKFSFANWLFGLRYQVTPDTMAYLTFSKGVTTGQINPQNPPQWVITLPETLKQLEWGVKSTVFVGAVQVRANLAMYYGWYKNIQSTLTTNSQVNPPPAPPTTLVVSANSAAGLTRGADAELTMIPVEWFELTGAAAYNKNKYTNWPIYDLATGAFLYNRSRPFIGGPKFKWNMTGTFHVPMDEAWGKISVSATYEHTSRNWYYASPNIGQQWEYQNYPHFIDVTAANGFGPLSSRIGGRLPTDNEDPFHNVDMEVRWRDTAGVDGLTTTFAVTNVTGNEGGYGTGYSWFAAGTNAHDPTPPRMFTLNFKYSF